MKSIFLIFIIFVSFFQSQTVTIDLKDDYISQPDGFYRKDMNNSLNPFEGTYIYTNGNTSLKIVLEKKIKQFNGSYYEDLIIGEYQYIVNGVEKINTLSQLNTVYSNQIKHKIHGNLITTNNNTRLWKCPQCLPNEKRLLASIKDTFSERFAGFYMRRTVINGQQVLQVKITDISTDFWNNPPKEFTLPKGEFTMIKQ